MSHRIGNKIVVKQVCEGVGRGGMNKSFDANTKTCPCRYICFLPVHMILVVDCENCLVPDDFPLDSCFSHDLFKASKGAKIRNRYNQVPLLTQDTNWKVTNPQLYTTNESQEVSPFPAGEYKAQIHVNRRAQRYNKHKTEKKQKKVHKRSTALERSVKYFTGGLKPCFLRV